jgi:hypothetical protein
MVKSMDSVTSKKQHFKTRLAGNDGCEVVFCEGCNTLELNLGALTLHLNPESMYSLSSVLNQAKVRLNRLDNFAAANEPVQVVSSKIVH